MNNYNEFLNNINSSISFSVDKVINNYKERKNKNAFYARYLERNKPEVIKPFISAHGWSNQVIFYNQHIFVYELKDPIDELLDDSFERIELNDTSFSDLNINFDSFYSTEYNIGLIVIPLNYISKLKLAIDLCKMVSKDFGKDTDLTLTKFLNRIIGE